uniref:Uncharacterized protein n=1 Tax=Plectus sambesii TaxID=2011161 RepID=A0A914XPC3_9BILA
MSRIASDCGLTTQICSVCGAQSSGFHFSAESCAACAAFFRRTVTLNRKFVCRFKNACVIDHQQRSMCRACRYEKCIGQGMERHAVQPRRDFIGAKWAKVHTQSSAQLVKPSSRRSPLPDAFTILPNEFIQQQLPYSDILERKSSVDKSVIKHRSDCSILEHLLKEEAKINDRRKILYSQLPIIAMLDSGGDFPFAKNILRPGKLRESRENSRAELLLIYEWMRALDKFDELPGIDRVILFKHCVAHHIVLEQSYLTMLLGYPEKWVFPNGTYCSISPHANDGWEDEPDMTEEMKRKLFMPLLQQSFDEIVVPMVSMGFTWTEYAALKALIFWRGGPHHLTERTRQIAKIQRDLILSALFDYYRDKPDGAQRY